MLVARGSWSHVNAVGGHEVGTRGAVVFGGAGVTSDGIDSVAMRAIERDDGVRGGLEGSACFIFHQESMEISTETVAEEEEAGEATDGSGMNWTLIVN
jgi:hypothetical protein